MTPNDSATPSPNKRKPSIEQPWRQYYSQDDIDAPLPTTTIYELLVENNHSHPEDTALLYLDTNITYGELLESIDQCARAMSGADIKRDDIVTVALPSIPETIIAFYAINRIGAVAHMEHPFFNTKNLCKTLNDTGCHMLVMLADNITDAGTILDSSPVETIVTASPLPLPTPANTTKHGKVVIPWKDFIRQGSHVTLPPPMRASHDYALISHTGGTTGTQKDVVCTNLNIQAEIFQGLAGIKYHRQECIMATLPPFINYSLVSTMLRHLSHGLKVVLIPHYQPEKFVEYVQRYQVNHILTIPAYWKAILHIPDIEKANLSSLKFLASGGEHLDLNTEEEVSRLLKHCGAKGGLIKGTGMTEMTCATTYSLPWRNPPGSVGSPLVKTNCKVVDVNNGEELTYNQEGEVCFAGPTMMAGYYHNPEATKQIIHTDSDGTRWLHTGDLGFLTEEGILFITGRMKRLILTRDSNGMVTKVFPHRIEQIILALPMVEDCCVVGVDDQQHITHPRAFVQPKPEADASQVKADVIQACHNNLPAYMVPKDVIVISEMPRTERGKTDYRALEQFK